jgi:aspartyl-tRNA synthetase
MSFVTQEEVWKTMEPVIGGIFEAFADGKAVTPSASSRASPMTRPCSSMAATSPTCATR